MIFKLKSRYLQSLKKTLYKRFDSSLTHLCNYMIFLILNKIITLLDLLNASIERTNMR